MLSATTSPLELDYSSPTTPFLVFHCSEREIWAVGHEVWAACVVRIPSNLHVCFLNRACSLISPLLPPSPPPPPFLFFFFSFSCKSTGDATREKCNKTNSCSQRCARLCTGAFCLLAAHPPSFHLSVIPPHVLSFALYIHLSPGILFFFLCVCVCERVSCYYYYYYSNACIHPRL